MTVTAAYIITQTLHLFGILDQTENPTPTDVANNVQVLNDMLRNELADGAAQYLMSQTTTVLPQGVSGQIYQFSVGTASSSYLVQKDVIGVKAIWMNDINITINRETRQAPKADVVRTTFPGIVTKWHQERQVDGSVLVTAWSPPRAAAPALIEYGGRLPPITAADGSDIVGLPPEGVMDATLLLGLTVCGSYGRILTPNDKILERAERVNNRWRNWARGQQWLRFVRA